MHDKELIRVHIHPSGPDAWFATITTITNGNVTRLYTTPTHLDIKSLKGWIRDFNDALKNSMCAWCGEPAYYITEIDDLQIFGFCSEADYTAALKEAEDMERTGR